MSEQKESTKLGTRHGSAVEWVERDEPQWMVALRKKAFDSFTKSEWPTPQEEEWRRTDISALDLTAYDYVEADAAAGKKSDVPGEKRAGVIEFDNRRCVYSELSPELKEKGVRLISLSEAIREENRTIESVFEE